MECIAGKRVIRMEWERKNLDTERAEARVGGRWRQKTHLDAGEAEDARLLALEPLVDLVRVVAVDVGLGHEREGHAVVDLAELGDLLVVLGLLAAKLVSG